GVGPGTVAVGDFDGDGQADLLVISGALRVYRNDRGRFKAIAAGAGIKSLTAPTSAIVGDYDNDGHLDVLVMGRSGTLLLHNNGDGTFRDRPPAAGIADTVPATPGLFADLDNDGFLDLFAGDFYRNDGTGTFTRDTRAVHPTAGDVLDAVFFDFDNDGWLDLITAGPKGLVLLHNDQNGRFSDRTALLPAGLAHSGARQVFAFDYDDDGDLDLLVVGLDGQVHLLRNDGGNANEFVNVRLVALRDGSGKNNYFGIGSRLELRAKDLYQMRVVDQPVVHFGLGNRLKADVLRVVWTNGVPQTYYYRGGEAGGADRNVLDEQVLKA